MRVLLVQVAAAQNIMDAASKGVFCLSAQRTMALIFVESAMSFHVKKRRDCLKKQYIGSGWKEINKLENMV